MTLEEGISIYVQQKQAIGMSFAKGYKTYGSFIRTVGNLDISKITVQSVSEFLERPHTSVTAFRRRHSLLRRFFEYWVAHGAIAALPMPSNRPVQRSYFLPYVYTIQDLRKLLRLALVSTTPNDKIHRKTIRAALITLYATGATVSEVTRLAKEDIDLRNGVIKFSGSKLKVSRCVPIGRDLVRIAQQYVAWQEHTGAQNEFFFSKIDGTEITSRGLGRYFERVRKTAGISGYRQSSQRPCLRDLRTTFAVHRITSWIKIRKDLNRMLPALGAYMGNVGLDSTERYLRLTPQRFKNALNTLSPQNSHPRWREDSVLLEFLANL